MANHPQTRIDALDSINQEYSYQVGDSDGSGRLPTTRKDQSLGKIKLSKTCIACSWMS